MISVNLGQLRCDLQLMKCIPHIIKPCSQLSNSQGFANAYGLGIWYIENMSILIIEREGCKNPKRWNT